MEFSLSHRAKHLFSRTGICIVACGLSSAQAVDLLPNGDFEAASLIGWHASESRDGITDLVREGNCYAPEDTTHITLSGDYSAVLRSGPSGRRSSVGILTSDPFFAGDGIIFTALTGTRDGRRVKFPVQFEVRILNGDNETLTAQTFSTSVARLKQGCPSEPRDGTFYVHYIDTRKFLDQNISIQFRQNTNTSGIQPFTLIDQVIKFEKGEAPVFTGRPEPRAAISKTLRGDLRLDASHSFDPDEGPLALTYRWQIDGETKVRVGEYPCVNDLSDGEYVATLFANDGFAAVSDSIKFLVTGNPVAAPADDGEGDTGNDDNDKVIQVTTEGCDGDQIDTETSVDDGTAASPPDSGEEDSGEEDSDMDDSEEDEEENTPPTLDLDEDNSSLVWGNNYSVEYSDPAVPIGDTDITIADEDGDNIESAIITLQNRVVADGDMLIVDDIAVPSGITYDINVSPLSVTVSFSGSSSASSYQDAIGAVSFSNTTFNDSTSRSITVVVSDEFADSDTAFSSIISP